MHIPAGIITLWFGAIVDIPTGWALCDGNNGTPDLTDKFVPGAGGDLVPGNEGGGINHSHTFTSIGHSHTLASGPTVAPGVTWSSLTTTVNDTGTTDITDGRPPFYALAYIMSL